MFTKFRSDRTSLVMTASRSSMRFSVRKWEWLLYKPDIEVVHRSDPGCGWFWCGSTTGRSKMRTSAAVTDWQEKALLVKIYDPSDLQDMHRDALKHSARANVWPSNGTVTAKLKNGRTLKLYMHADANDAFWCVIASHEHIEDVILVNSECEQPLHLCTLPS